DLDSNIWQDESETKLWQNCGKIVNLPQSTDSVTCKIGIAPAAASSFLDQYDQLEQLILGRIHASSGLGRLQLTATSEVSKKEILEKMRSHCQQHQGFLSILDAPTTVKQQIDVWGYSGNALKTMTALKNQFDPQNILNPGRFII
ncbi:MAG: FAD-linked oxidase C-terminal domain-containing protein, partial [Cyanobacteria bacterium J06631_2]